MFKSRNRKQGRRDARIAWNLSLTSQIGMNISLTTEPCNGANCATFFLIQIWAWFSLEILPRFRRRFSSWVVSYGRVPFFVPIHSNPVFFLPSFLSLEFISKHIHAHICLEDKNKRRRRERKARLPDFRVPGVLNAVSFFHTGGLVAPTTSTQSGQVKVTGRRSPTPVLSLFWVEHTQQP